MSRTFGLTTPSRRSKRLLESGYYRYDPGDVALLLDKSSSEDDESASVGSNVSQLSYNSDQRRVTYKESPTTHSHFKFHRRHHSKSPVTHVNENMPSTSHQMTAHSEDFRTNRLKVVRKRARKVLTTTSSAAAMPTHDKNGEAVVGTISTPLVPLRRRELQRREHVSRRSFEAEQELESGEVTFSHNLAAGEHMQLLRQQYSRPDNITPSSGDKAFKVSSTNISTKAAHKHSHVRIQAQTNQSPVYSEYNEVAVSSDSDEQVQHDKYFQFEEAPLRFLFILFSLVQFSASYFIGIIWEAGKMLYQAVTKLLVFDVWFLSSSVNIGTWHKRRLILLTILVFSGLLLILLLYMIGYEEIWSYAVAPLSYFYSSLWMQSGEDRFTFPHDVSHGVAIDETMQKLELSLREMELRIADRHASVLQSIKDLKLDHEQDLSKLSENQREVVASLENVIEKSIAIELLKNNDMFQRKIDQLKLEINYLRNNQSLMRSALEEEMYEKVELNKEKYQPIMERLDGFENLLPKFERNVEELRKDHSTFKASVEKQAGNLTFLRELSNDQFIHNFLLFLQKGSSKPAEEVTEHRRYHHLSTIFIEWLFKRGFLQQKDLNKIREETFKNSTDVQVQFKTELENSINSLRKSTVSKPAMTLENVITQDRFSNSRISEKLVKTWIQEALDVYSADRIGLPDFALESAGASVVNTRCSESYQHKTALVSVLGIPIYYDINSPRSLIQPSVMPGECWAFKGSQGYAVISLSSAVRPTAFTIDHIPKSLALYNNISSAPKDFTVYGLKDGSDVSGVMLGNFRYEENGDPIQHFVVQDSYKSDDMFSFIELRVASNWGHPEFTCLYRFRVHGERID